MSESTLSPDLRRFILARITSVPLLEALLLLRTRVAGWELSEITSRLYVSESVAADLVDELVRQGLAQRDATFARYMPMPPELAAIVDELATVYARHLVQVTQLIHSSTEQKAHRFADAFMIRKDPR